MAITNPYQISGRAAMGGMPAIRQAQQPAYTMRAQQQATAQNIPLEQWIKQNTSGGLFRGLGNVGDVLKKGHEGMLGSYTGRKYMGTVGALMAGGYYGAQALGGGGAGAGAGGYAGETAAGLAGHSAGGIGAGAAGAGGAAAGAGGAAAAGGSFPWAAVAQGGSQLLSGYLNKRASDKASNQQKQNTAAALAQLSPEAIRQLVQMFYTQNYAMLNPQMQAAQQGLSSSAARSGLTGAGVVQQLRAGIPGQFANTAFNAASQQGLGVASQRAGIQAGQPVNTPYSFGNDLQGLMQMLGRYGILRNNQQQPTQQQNQWWVNGPGYDDNEYR